MMRTVFFLFAFICTSVLYAQKISLQQARDQFEKAAQSEASCKMLIDNLSGVTAAKNPILYGYLGAAETIYAQFSYNPYTKLSRFNTGKGKLDAALLAKPDALELIYLRFTVQSGAPSFLGYNSQLSSDKKKLIDGLKPLSTSDYDLYKRISAYLKQSAQLDTVEKQRLTTIINSVSKP